MLKEAAQYFKHSFHKMRLNCPHPHTEKKHKIQIRTENMNLNINIEFNS